MSELGRSYPQAGLNFFLCGGFEYASVQRQVHDFAPKFHFPIKYILDSLNLKKC